MGLEGFTLGIGAGIPEKEIGNRLDEHATLGVRLAADDGSMASLAALDLIAWLELGDRKVVLPILDKASLGCLVERFAFRLGGFLVNFYKADTGRQHCARDLLYLHWADDISMEAKAKIILFSRGHKHSQLISRWLIGILDNGWSRSD